MARIDDDDIRRVREATDLVQLVGERVILKQKGRLFWGCCPFHDEKSPSFKIDPETQLWHCFGCGKGGDVFGFLMELEHLEFPEAIRQLADRAHIEIKESGGAGLPRGKRERLISACDEASRFYHMQLMRSKESGASKARAYLHERGFGSDLSGEWQIGYAPGHGRLVDHLHAQGFARDELIEANLAYAGDSGRLTDRFFDRVMFPVRDLQGRTIAFGGRVIGRGEPKYLNTSETPIFHKSSNMFGIDRAKSHMVETGVAVVVEGYTDVIAVHDAGIDNVVATLGTALTVQHVKLLSRFAHRIVYLFDGDAAGLKAADRASEFIDWNSALESGRNPIELMVAILPDGKDPAEYVASAGAEALNHVIQTAQPLLHFSINRRLDAYDLRSPEQKVRAMEDALSILLPIKGSITATDYVNLIADRLNVEYTSVAQALNEAKAPVAARHEDEQAGSEFESRPTTAAATKIIDADRKSIQMERELISLTVTDIGILDDIERDLARIDWVDQEAESMADALLTVDRTSTPAQTLSAVQVACAQAPSLLAQTMIETENQEETLFKARLLIRSLRERDLERRIRAGKARLRENGILKAEEEDRLFEQIVSLQKELGELRNEKHGGYQE